MTEEISPEGINSSYWKGYRYLKSIIPEQAQHILDDLILLQVIQDNHFDCTDKGLQAVSRAQREIDRIVGGDK